MRPEKQARFDRWLARHLPRAARVRLQATHVDRDETIREWTGDELQQVNIALFLDVAMDWAEDEEASAACAVECLDEKGAIFATKKFTAIPEGEDGKPLSAAALNAHKGASLEKVLVHFMQHDTAKTKIVVGFLGTALAGMSELQKMNQATIEKLDARNARLEATIEAILLKRESSAEVEEEEEARATVEAVSKLKALLAEVAPHALAYVTERMNGAGGGGQPQ